MRHLTSISKEALEYAASDEAAMDILVGAILIDNMFTQVLVNFWLKVNKPKTPTKLFTNESEAFSWLKTFL